jgi:hypothetical protein
MTYQRDPERPNEPLTPENVDEAPKGSGSFLLLPAQSFWSAWS